MIRSVLRQLRQCPSHHAVVTVCCALIGAGPGPRSIRLLQLTQPITRCDCCSQNLGTFCFSVSSNQSLQNLPGVEYRRLSLASLQTSGKCAAWHLQGKQPARGSLRSNGTFSISARACKIVQCGNN